MWAGRGMGKARPKSRLGRSAGVVLPQSEKPARNSPPRFCAGYSVLPGNLGALGRSSPYSGSAQLHTLSIGLRRNRRSFKMEQGLEISKRNQLWTIYSGGDDTPDSALRIQWGAKLLDAARLGGSVWYILPATSEESTVLNSRPFLQRVFWRLSFLSRLFSSFLTSSPGLRFTYCSRSPSRPYAGLASAKDRGLRGFPVADRSGAFGEVPLGSSHYSYRICGGYCLG